MKTAYEVQKDWESYFEKFIQHETGEIIEGKAAFIIYLEEGKTIYQALSKTTREMISGKEIYDYCFKNFEIAF